MKLETHLERVDRFDIYEKVCYNMVTKLKKLVNKGLKAHYNSITFGRESVDLELESKQKAVKVLD